MLDFQEQFRQQLQQSQAKCNSRLNAHPLQQACKYQHGTQFVSDESNDKSEPQFQLVFLDSAPHHDETPVMALNQDGDVQTFHLVASDEDSTDSGVCVALVTGSTSVPDHLETLGIDCDSHFRIPSETSCGDQLLDMSKFKKCQSHVQSCPENKAANRHLRAPMFSDHLGHQCQQVCTATGTLTGQESHAVHRDRLRRESHNKIERRRRYNINDRIKDLEDLLPPSSYKSVDSKLNKGTILKASVDYIQVLKRDQSQLQEVTWQLNLLHDLNSKLWLHIQHIEQTLEACGVTCLHSLPVNSVQLWTEMSSMQEQQSVSTETEAVRRAQAAEREHKD